jgi:hypothetical protein
MKLNSGQLNLMRLTRRDGDGDGWARVSSVVWPAVGDLPDELVEKRPSDDGGHIRLTEAGRVVLRYSE